MFENNKLVKIIFTAFAAIGVLFVILGIILALVTSEGALGIMAVFGAIFALIGIIPLVIINRKVSAKKDLIDNGYKSNATVTEVVMNMGMTVNGVNPYKIHCQGSDANGNMINFVSENVLARLDNSLVGTPITVYVSRTDPSKYYVDVSKYNG